MLLTANVTQNSARKCARLVQREVGVSIRFILPASLLKINVSLLGKDVALIRLELETLRSVCKHLQM